MIGIEEDETLHLKGSSGRAIFWGIAYGTLFHCRMAYISKYRIYICMYCMDRRGVLVNENLKIIGFERYCLFVLYYGLFICSYVFFKVGYVMDSNILI